MGNAKSFGVVDAGYHALAFAGGNYEAVWSDPTGANVFAARVSKSGVLLDTKPVAVATTGSLGSVWVSAGASHFLVTWSDARNDAGTSSVYGARLGFDGTLLDTNGVELAAGGSVLGTTYASATGFAVAWSAGSGSYVAGISEASLTVTPPAGTALDSPLLASNGTQALVAWTSNGRSVASPLNAAGAPALDPPVGLGEVDVPDGVATLATSGSGFLTMWSSLPPGGAPAAYWVRPLDAAGTPLAAPTKLPAIDSTALPSLVWTGSIYVAIAYSPSTGSASAVRIKPDGTPVDAAPVPFLNLASDAASPPATLAVYGGGGGLYALTSTGSVTLFACDETLACPGAPVIVSGAGTATGAGADFVDATHLEVAWTDATGLHASLVDAKAMTAGAAVGLDATPGTALPMVARGAAETAVGATRPQDGSIAIYRLDSTGALLDGPHSTQSPPGIQGASLIWDGAHYVLAWTQPGNGLWAYASDLGTSGSNFGLSAPVPAFAETTNGAPSVARMGDGGALLVVAPASGASVLGVPWKVVPDGGVSGDGGIGDGGPGGMDATVDAGGDAAPASDGGPSSNEDAGASDAGGADGGIASSGGGSGCSCRTASPSGGSPFAALGAAVGLAVALRWRRRAKGAGLTAVTLGALVLGAGTAHASPALTVGSPSPFDSPVPTFGGVQWLSGPRLGTDGTNFLLTYVDLNESTRAIRIGPDGKPLDAASFVPPCFPSAMAPANGGYLLACGTDPLVLMGSDGSVKAHLDNPGFYIDALASSPSGYLATGAGTGVLLDANGKIASATLTFGNGTAAWANGTYLVVWGQSGNLMGQTVSPSGVVGAPAVVATAAFNPNVSSLVLAGGDTGFLAVWIDTSTSVQAARISTAGALVDPGVVTLKDGFVLSGASAAFRAGTYAVTWNDDGPRPGVYTATVNEATGATTAGGVYDGAYGYPIVAANAAATYCAVFPAELNQQSPPVTLYGERLDVTGAPLAPLLATPGELPNESQTILAGSSAGFLGAWVSSGGGVWIGAAGPAGEKLWDALRLYPGAAEATKGDAPQSAWTGSGWLVTWQYDDPTTSAQTGYGARVSVDGTVLDAAPIALTSGISGIVQTAAVTGAGGHGLFAWADASGIKYSVVDAATGAVSPMGVMVAEASDTGVFRGLAAATDGTKFEIVYSSPTGLFAASIDPASTAPPSVVSLAPDEAFGAVSLAFQPSGYVVEAQTSTGLRGFTFDATGAHVTALPVLSSISTAPAVAYDGLSLVLAWSGASPVENALYAATLDATGVLGAPVTVLAQGVSGGVSLATAGSGASMLGATFAELTHAAAVGVPLVDAEGMDAGAPGDGGLTDGGVPGDGGGVADASNEAGGEGGVEPPPSMDASTGDAASGDLPGTSQKGGGGCSCRATPEAGNSLGGWVGLLLLVAGWRRGRKG
ncbi:MAG TPA: MYXO-CTERM sorting domain-containing protein [Polyangiaceae bacterium]